MQLHPDARGRVGIGEQNSAECDVLRTRGNELECVESRLNSTHPDDRHFGCAVAARDGRECDRFQRRPGEPSLAGPQDGTPARAFSSATSVSLRLKAEYRVGR